MNRVFVRINKPEDWRPLLAKPHRHWRTGYSAKALAYCWRLANGFPKSVRKVFENSGIPLFRNLELLMAFPEYKVSLPPRGGRPSQNDIFVLAKGNGQLVAIMVEGKVSEPFGETVAEWRADSGKGKEERLEFLLNELGLSDRDVSTIRYQLLHRTASATIEAKRFSAKSALVLIYSFSQCDEWFEDYVRYLSLFNLENITTNSLVYAQSIRGVDLYFGWVRGDQKYWCI